MSDSPDNPNLDESTAAALAEVARRFGTPTYAYDVRRLRSQVDKLRVHLPDDVEVLYSLKANASLGISDVLADYGLGADVASAGELATAVEAGFPANRIFVAGPYQSEETIRQLQSLPEAVVSIDSVSELESFGERRLPNRVVLRLRPDFGSNAVVSAGKESRFGVLFDELQECRAIAASHDVDVIGFHVFAGSQVLDTAALLEHLNGAFDLSCRAADALGIQPEYLNLGGGFGIPYAADEREFDLSAVGEALQRLVDRASPARLVLELGRYLVAQAGWYVTTVVGHQTNQGRPAVVVDGGTHQRADLCGLCLRSKARPSVVLGADASDGVRATDVLGCLSLPADVLAEASPLPPLERGDVLAFGNAGAYGWWSSPALFHGSPLPAEVAFDDEMVQLMRARRGAESLLADQRHVVQHEPIVT